MKIGVQVRLLSWHENYQLCYEVYAYVHKITLGSSMLERIFLLHTKISTRDTWHQYAQYYLSLA